MSESIDTGITLSAGDVGRPERAEQARRLLTLLMETERAIYRDPDIASTYLNQAISLLTVTRHNKTSYKPRGGLASWQMSRIDKFINNNISNSIRTIELASLLSLSPSHFTHAFKQTTGMTPLVYVAAMRVKAAQQFMLCSTRSLSDVALSHGFCDQAHFCRVFRRETGLSPQTWRKLYASNA
ncbi:AraC family transcriptional regulator [Ectopseudomonas guguanensis]|jgi:transcriptional regulator GlxA family with amidase domain|uniref:AraC family transcriptional regulator n=1 Tax=Ectopseudomonas guguanensis TaxID=1198456 RepID=UPI0028B0574C|nr:AraC family transcriptional regulator [Pseudomonas guguanensis]